MLLDVSAVTFSYGRRTPVFRDLSLHIAAGERVGLVGPNGSGKSTLIRAIADLLQLRGGSIRIDGRSHRERAARESIVHIASNDYLPQFLTGREYVDLMHRFYGLEPDEQRLDDLMSRYQLAARQHDLIEDYSHGMRKKVQVVSGLLLARPLTIVDETLNGVDVDALYEFEHDAERMPEGNALLLCSHDFRLLEAVCDRVIVLCRGDIVHDLPLRRVREEFGSVDAMVKQAIGASTPRGSSS
ncbi:ATP-binding cassette domain-containing protein [Microbacterium sp. 179-I 3D2 NHS]|uniref:ATP-binding cassette domain-containing protein n=1 Tax=Microbacterium sp. 179-I 3D2 NHS TaxID=3235178 RepID=UPI0039A2B4DF